MATDNTKTTTEENKSLLTKTKDTLIGLKNQAQELLFASNKDEKIQGMSRLEFEATKAKLESILHFKKQKDLPQQQQQQVEAETNLEWSKKESGLSRQQVEAETNLEWSKKESGLSRQQVEAETNLEWSKKESGLSRFGNETIYSASVNEKFEQVNKEEFAKPPDVLLQKTEFHDDKKDEIKYSKMDKDEIHVLPTLHVEEKPIIIEKEIEYEKPVEIKQTIIHKEKPIIIEQPIIKEKHEHYREATEYKKTDTKIVKETVSEQDVGNKDTEALLNLRKERIDKYSNNSTPIVKKEKEFVQLDVDVREQPTQVHEKQVIYQQPVEIQKTHIEKIKPKVREEITLEKEHIHEKLAPEVYQENVKKSSTDQYFSQEATTADNLSTVTNDTTTTQRDTLTTNIDAESRVAAGEQKKRKEEVLL